MSSKGFCSAEHYSIFHYCLISVRCLLFTNLTVDNTLLRTCLICTVNFEGWFMGSIDLTGMKLVRKYEHIYLFGGGSINSSTAKKTHRLPIKVIGTRCGCWQAFFIDKNTFFLRFILYGRCYQKQSIIICA